MSKEVINPPGLFPSLHYGFSQIVVAAGARTVFLSGQTAWDAHERIVGGADLGEQTHQALRNVQIAIEAAGGALQDVVVLRIYFVERVGRDVSVIGAALRTWFPEDPPASTWIGVSSLARSDFLIEIEATAVLGAAGGLDHAN